MTHLKKISKKLAKQLRVLQNKFDIQTAVLKQKEGLLKDKDDLLKGKDDLLDEKSLSQNLAATIIREKKAEITALKMDLLRAKGLLSARGIFERILQLIHEETSNLHGRFNAMAVCANIALHTSDGIFFSVIEVGENNAVITFRPVAVSLQERIQKCCERSTRDQCGSVGFCPEIIYDPVRRDPWESVDDKCCATE